MSEIKLPDLPPHDKTLAHDVGCPVYRALDMMCFAKDAVELDRQGRGEPVGNVEIKGTQVAMGVSIDQLGDGSHLLYTAPQPANPTIKESLTVAEPAKEVSDGWPPMGSAARDSELLAAISWYGSCAYARAKDPQTAPNCLPERKAWDSIYALLARYGSKS